MDDNKQEPNGWKVGLAAVGLFVVIGMLFGLPPNVASPVFGAIEACSILAFIYVVVRGIARRTKGPPDPP